MFAKNRAEELPDDLWGRFVLPLDFTKIALDEKTKAVIIVGGRGSGKTMFIKYHCHATTFSPNRQDIDTTALKFIGIHWRPDTAFIQNIKEEWLGKNWESAFNSFISITILIEFSKLVQNILNSKIQEPSLKTNLRKLEIPKPIRKILEIDTPCLIDSEDALQDALFEITNWINLPSSDRPPYNIDLRESISLLIRQFKKASSLFLNSNFHIFIDEFENLTNPQQKVINTWLKHGKPPILFSIAHKKHANVTCDTKSQEKLEERDDFRFVDVEKIYYDPENPKNFEILAAEVLLLNLCDYLNLSDFDDLVKAYSDISTLNKRKQADYQKQLKALIAPIFPSQSAAFIAKNILDDKTLKDRLKNNLIGEGLKLNKGTTYSSKDFINSHFAEASIINGALLNRTTITAAEVKTEFDQLIKTGKSTRYKAWIQNNLVGVILYLYNSLSHRVCPLYAGFPEFILMSKGNLRHFLELCFQSLLRAESSQPLVTSGSINPVPIDVQAKATKTTSTNQLSKIINAGSNGKHLQRIANRLGILFAASQKRKSQSEPEVNHFTVNTSDVSLLDEQIQMLLNESLIWSVLIKQKSTKNKTDSDIELVDYILHPVLSCHFGISPRKKRKIKLTPEELTTIFVGNEKRFNALLKLYHSKWDVEALDSTDSNDNEQYKLSW